MGRSVGRLHVFESKSDLDWWRDGGSHWSGPRSRRSCSLSTVTLPNDAQHLSLKLPPTRFLPVHREASTDTVPPGVGDIYCFRLRARNMDRVDQTLLVSSYSLQLYSNSRTRNVTLGYVHCS